jgi:hypothetical protein
VLDEAALLAIKCDGMPSCRGGSALLIDAPDYFAAAPD